MKNIFIRAGLSPLDNCDASTMLKKNLIGTNVGNLVYAYSIYRTLMTDESVNIVPNYYKVEPSWADRMNEQYDCFVIPLADAFRPDFMPELQRMTELIKKLKIPCIVVGVGLRAPFEPGKDIKYPFDDKVKEFMKAVLDKSAIVGLRGEITSQYLSGLGFKEGVDHTVIGCPSMYLNGPDINIRKTVLTKESRVSINSSVLSPENVHQFLDRSARAIPDHYFLPQRIQEMRLLYTGIPYVHEYSSLYPSRLSHPVYKENRVKFFLSAKTWFDFLKTVDLSFGGRLHGNIAGIVSGTPSILIPHDARMRELVNYHQLPHIWAKDVHEDTDIFHLFERMDFDKTARAQAGNFIRYKEFLDKNGLEHIFKDGTNPKTAPLDSLLQKLALHPPIESFLECGLEEQSERLLDYYTGLEKDKNKFKRENKKLKEETKTLKDENNKLKENNKKSAGRVKALEKECRFYKEELEKPVLMRVGKKAAGTVKKILKK